MKLHKLNYFMPPILLAAIVLSSCGGEITSQSSEELKALWVVDANRHTQQVRVLGRAGEVRENRPASVTFFPTNLDSDSKPFAESENDDLFNEYLSESTPIRLTGGDVMNVVTAADKHQLYRRSKPLEYQTSFAFDENSTDYELRLEYSAARFPASVTSARVFAVSDLRIVDADTVVARDGVINVSWNIGDLMIASNEQFTQTLKIDLLDCNSDKVGPASASISIPAIDRAITLLAGQLPNPVNTNGSATSAQGECTYGLQLLARTVPMPATSEPTERNVTPEVLIISRSTQQRVSVAQGPQVSQ